MKRGSDLEIYIKRITKSEENDFSKKKGFISNEILNKPDFSRDWKNEFSKTLEFKVGMKSKWLASK